MRVEWKTVSFSQGSEGVLTLSIPSDLLFFCISDKRQNIIRYGQISDEPRPDSIESQVEFLLKKFKDEGSCPRDLSVKVVGRFGAEEVLEKFKKVLSKFSLDVLVKKIDSLNAKQFRLSASTGDLWMKNKSYPLGVAGSNFPPPRREVENKRVLIVEDSPTVQKLLHKIFSEIPGISVVGVEDTVQGAERFLSLNQVQFISLDMKLKDGLGVDLLKKINLLNRPLLERIDCLLVTDCSPSEGGLVLDAMGLGATAYLQKPRATDLRVFADEMKSLLEDIVAGLNEKTVEKTPRLKSLELANFELIAIGSSTGGTEVVAQLIQHLPTDCPPIVVVQHMPPDFTRLYAERLSRQTGRITTEVTTEIEIQAGQAYIASGGSHLVISRHEPRVKVTCKDGDPVNRFKPSVSVLFDSILNHKLAPKTLALMLTGMGCDGAAEMLKLKGAGAITIGQSQESCAVYGMPRAAAELGALSFVASPEEMVRNLKSQTGEKHFVLAKKGMNP